MDDGIGEDFPVDIDACLGIAYKALNYVCSDIFSAVHSVPLQ